MRVLCLSQDLGIPFEGPKGASAHLRSVVSGFRDAGHQVTVHSPAIEAGDEIRRAVPLPALGDGLSSRVPKRVARALSHIWANAGVEAALEHAVAGERPDLVYERYGPFAVAGGIVARRHGIPHLLEVNAPLAREGALYRNQALGEAAAALEASAFDTAGAVLAVSRELKDELVADGVAAGRIHVMPNGFDTARFRPAALREGPPVTFGFVGGLRPWHGIADMAEAFRRVARRTDCRLLVIGQGPEEERLHALAEELPGRVELTGAVDHDEVPAALARMDVALAPYPALERFYYSPLKLLEYMGAGRAIIASRIGQVGELVTDGETGLTVPPGDVEALADAMLRLAADPTLRASLGARAAEVAHREHGWDTRIARIIEIARGLGANR